MCTLLDSFLTKHDDNHSKTNGGALFCLKIGSDIGGVGFGSHLVLHC